MKGVYLCARKHRIPKADLDYNDVIDYPGINKLCDCLDVLFEEYDYIIATPPCNYYSRANYRRETSIVAQSTKHLLPIILDRCIRSGKPFLIENVCNSSLLPIRNCYMFDFGNHTFYSNILILKYDDSFAKKQNKQHVCRNKRDDNYNVHIIIDLFLEQIGAYEGE